MNDRQQLLLEQWKMASGLYRHIDNITWQAASYFIAIDGILLGVLGAVTTSAAPGRYASLLKVVLVAIPVFGALISWVWAVVQKRTQLYHSYRLAQARQAEEALIVDRERVLTLHEKSINDLNEQDFQSLKDPYFSRFRVYLETWLGKSRAHDLIFMAAIILTTIWVALLPLVSWYTFRSAWVCVLVSVIPFFLWLWLVWDACLLPLMKRPSDQADA